jgi:hypothetical protein
MAELETPDTLRDDLRTRLAPYTPRDLALSPAGFFQSRLARQNAGASLRHEVFLVSG